LIGILVNTPALRAAARSGRRRSTLFARLWRRISSALRCIKAVVAGIRERRRATIVNITSFAGRTTTASVASYNASK
jgi:NADP-dependent 3-hydroxy acid dehydrogenase YdfG